MRGLGIGHIVREAPDKIVVFGYGNERFDIPKSEILAVGRNIITKKNFPELDKFKVDRNSPLPTGEPLEKIDEEAYPEYYHGPIDDKEEGKHDHISKIKVIVLILTNKINFFR
jgi:hypothetical protein